MMRRFVLGAVATALLFGQPLRDAYRLTYKNWRQSSVGLEQNAAAPTADFSVQVASAAKGAKDYLDARGASLTDIRGLAEELPAQNRSIIRTESLLGARPEIHRLLTGTDGGLAKAITSFAGTTDPVIREVRQAMERERASLSALMGALDKREALLAGLTDASNDSERVLAGISKDLDEANAARADMVKGLRTEAVAWSHYYADLTEGAGSPVGK